jgi:DNA repair protein RecN (Recombination protein N)
MLDWMVNRVARGAVFKKFRVESSLEANPDATKRYKLIREKNAGYRGYGAMVSRGLPMLRFLRIRDFALIRDLEIEFAPGLNVLTGETGSGKSIIVDSLGLILGERSSQEMIRSNCAAAQLEGLFSLDSNESAARLLTESGIECSDNSLLVRREISASGRGRIFINDKLVTLSLLKSLGESLADIHGQHNQKSLYDLASHLEWLDRFGKNEEILAQVRDHFRHLREIALKLESHETNEQERLQRLDMLAYQVNEIRKANLQPGEKETLENEKNILSNREKIFALATEAYALLYENEAAILTQARRLERALQELGSFDSGWHSHLEFLRDSIYKLEDLAYAARDYAEGINFSPDRIDQIQRRLAEVDRLLKKYGSSVDEILAYAERCERESNAIVSHAHIMKALTEEFAQVEKNYRAVSERLSAKRRRDAALLERDVRKEFQALSMEKMTLSVRFDSRDEAPNSKGRIPSTYGPNGLERVEFMIAPNKGEEERPLAKIASGGELSRVMLAIQTLCRGGESSKTLVFDEVDAGIGGRVAEAVGRRLRDISSDNQVLCVTHLPQIAAFANQHFNVHKETVSSRTETMIERLDGQKRTQELARMLGGAVITETTRRHAEEMLEYSSGTVGSRERQAQKST